MNSLWFGFAAAAFLAADGYVRLFERARARARLLATAGIAFAAVAGAGGLAATALDDHAVVVRYAFLAPLTAALIAVLAARRVRLLEGAAVAAVALAPFNVVLDYVPQALGLRPDPVVVDRDVPPELYRALRWLRAHSDPDEIIAVNNQTNSDGQALYSAYSAFSERRFFVEGWKWGSACCIPEFEPIVFSRLALNERLFRDASASAARTIVREHGVRFALADTAHGTYPVSARLDSLGRVVFREGAVRVVELDGGL